MLDGFSFLQGLPRRLATTPTTLHEVDSTTKQPNLLRTSLNDSVRQYHESVSSHCLPWETKSAVINGAFSGPPPNGAGTDAAQCKASICPQPHRPPSTASLLTFHTDSADNLISPDDVRFPGGSSVVPHDVRFWGSVALTLHSEPNPSAQRSSCSMCKGGREVEYVNCRNDS